MRLCGHGYKGETEYPFVAEQNNAIRIKYIKAEIDNILKNSKCRLCGDKDEMINLMIA